MRKPGEHGGRLILRNLPFGFSVPQLTKLVGKIGEVKDLSMPWDEGRKRNKGFAFVEFTKKNLSEKAIKELNGKTFQHRVLSVDYAMSKTHYEKAIKTEELDHAFKPKHPANAPLSETPVPETPASDPVAEPEEAVEAPPTVPPKPSNKLFKDRTLFVRNLTYEIDDDDLRDFFTQFGPLHYARVVYSKETNQSKGTGFICYKDQASAQKAVAALGPDATPGEEMELEGRIPSVLEAVSRDEAGKIKPKQQAKDIRNLHLSREGIVMPNTPQFAALNPEEIEKRLDYARSKSQKLKKNPNIFVSRTRTLIRNLPKSLTSQDLKSAVRTFIVEFAPELVRKKLFTQVKIQLDPTRPDVDGNPRSKGFGFLDFKDPEIALRFVRKLSEAPYLFSKKRPAVVEFALDDVRMLRLRELRLERQKKRIQEMKEAERETEEPEKEKKLGRGARQRMKKRQRKEAGKGTEGPEVQAARKNSEGGDSNESFEALNTYAEIPKRKSKSPKPEKPSKPAPQQPKAKSRKKTAAVDDIEVLEFDAPRKRRKDKKTVDEDAALERLVSEYRNKLFSGFS